ncbi:MAG: ATP-grasp domain-containing protein [Muribaculaceae bacterium]|nr:ATP-grasp domain-containing protein [Muribaculaceae bacterium]
MNILVLSCGTRNMLIRYFKEEGTFGRVIGTDCSLYAPALYETDNHHIVPRITSPDYLDIILDICRQEKIDAILPLQEDELYLIASNQELFTNAGITPIVSAPETVDLCRDKHAFYRHLKQQKLPTLLTCSSFSEFQRRYKAGRINFPVFIKPVRGSGSIGARKVNNIELLSALCKYGEEDFLIQQFSEGKELGADVYIDMISHKPVSIFTKRKMRMRAGETEKSISIKDDALFDLIIQTVSSLSLTGPVDMDIFCIDGHYYISEINPRFGGGYPHAHSCGVHFPQFIANNIAGKENPDTIGDYEEGICMLKYSDLLTLQIL